MVKTKGLPTPKKHPPSGTNSSPSAQIVASPRPVKKRTASPRLKDQLSAQSSMTSQTMSSRTESTYSISQSSPRSQEGRPKVIVHMDEMDEQNSTKSSQNKKKKHGGSKGSSASKGKKGGTTTSGGTKTGSKHRRASLNSSASSTLGSSRSSMMGDASLEQKDSMVSCPKRWPTGKGQEHELVNVKESVDDDDDDTTDHSEEDKLSPLVDPVSVRLQKMDDKAKAAAPSSLQSVGTSSFSASYGSISLGGDASLSSADTFNNSPIGGKPSLDPSQCIPHKPDLQAKPQKKILKPNPNPNPISWNRQKFNADQKRDNHSNIETASASSVSVASASTSKWEEPLLFERPPAKPLGRTSMSVSSGECSIATFSEVASRDSWNNSQSSSLSKEDTERSKEKKSQDKSSGSKNSVASSIIDDSWNQGRMDAMFSVTTMGEDQSQEVCKMPARSYSSWTSSEELPPLQQTEKNWASSGQFTWKQGSLSLADWTSGDDSSSEDENEQEQKARNKKNAKPRSAFDKDAPWYCGDSDEDNSAHDSDSIRSDSSSVLSALKKKKAPKPKVAKNKVPSSESSMSFNDLVQPESMTLKDVEKASKSRKERVKQQDDSLSLGGLLDNKESSRRNRSSFLSKVDEDTIEVQLGQNSTKLKSGRSAIVDNQNSGDLEAGNMNNQGTVDDAPKSLRLRFGDLLKLLEVPWVRRAVYIGLVVFLICDIILVIVLLLR